MEGKMKNKEVFKKTVEYISSNKMLCEYYDNEYVVAEFRIDDGFPHKIICNTDVYYSKEKHLIIGKCGSGIRPETLALHTKFNNYVICKPNEVGKLFNEWKNLPSIREIRKNSLKNIIDDLSRRINKLKSELNRLEQ